MQEIELVKAQIGDEELIHKMKYDSFLPLYNHYQDTKTSPVKEPISKVIAHLKSDNCDYYVIKHNNLPVGAVRVVSEGENTYRISPLFIIPEYQNKGIGQAVINMLFDKYNAAAKWILSTIKEEKGNCHLYEKCGFVRTGKEEIINDRMTIVYYEKI